MDPASAYVSVGRDVLIAPCAGYTLKYAMVRDGALLINMRKALLEYVFYMIVRQGIINDLSLLCKFY